MEKPLNTKRGAITLSTGIIAAATIVASVVASYYTNQMAFSKEISTVNAKTMVTDANVQNITARLDRIDNKLDMILSRTGSSYTAGVMTQKKEQ